MSSASTLPLLTVVATGGTIDKDYPRATSGYAFEIDEPAARRVLSELPFLAVRHEVVSVCRKDSSEISDEDREAVSAAVRSAAGSRVVVTHGTDTMIETALFVLRSGAAAGKVVAFTGAMKPERFKDSDASFNIGAAVAATSAVSPPSDGQGAVVICMGGNVIDCRRCRRDLETGYFVEE
eukprot:TRINITY_DN38789_c0_g1_i1.p1 TRINITY_DN38789_c0_g1~~TRINITY_DN38789_c0_g1_i1.p1  ORF type:complete len:180 (-),score=37.26 TRINITY_DN38789_c0_g1_i1:137-676(-)